MHRPRRLDLDDDLIARAKAAAAELTGAVPTFRATVSLAVAQELAAVGELLTAAGLVSRPSGTPKAREVSDRDWDALGKLAEVVAADRVQLLRCCLERLARQAADNEQDR